MPTAQDVERVNFFVEERAQDYRQSSFLTLLTDPDTPVETKKATLTYLQPWSNAYQRMISARVVHEPDDGLHALALLHQQEEIGHNIILHRSHPADGSTVFDPIIEACGSWYVDQLSSLPGVHKAAIAHLALEVGCLVMSEAGLVPFPDDAYFALHVVADADHVEMGYEMLRERTDWTADEVIAVLDRAWQVIGVASDRIAECARRDTLA
ncbi:hypothetical protein AB0M54_16970 [Actinoplanes sp. NPDC051470]|uniref:hypothetical protein n=1 Tax=unclassified Actinoplanes TaxID=2626549 RepID=UPI00343D7BD8